MDFFFSGCSEVHSQRKGSKRELGRRRMLGENSFWDSSSQIPKTPQYCYGTVLQLNLLCHLDTVCVSYIQLCIFVAGLKISSHCNCLYYFKNKHV